MGFFDRIKTAIAGEQVDYNALIQAGALVVDVRTKSEFQSGHVKGSKNIPLQIIDKQLKALKGKVVILVCRSGARAAQAKNMLTQHGIEAHNAGAWQNI